MDEQDVAEVFDEETRGDDETVVGDPWPDDGYVHTRLGAPDQLGADHVAELVATEYEADDPLSAEESALHFEDH